MRVYTDRDGATCYPRAWVTETSEAGSVGARLELAQPTTIDAALIRTRLLGSMFGSEVPAPRFGRFELRERIGQGGMGVVYRAWDPQLERAVAIKLIDITGIAESLRERALREARSLARLAHPNVITVFEVGLTEAHVWIAMEFVAGTTMRDWLARDPRPDMATILRKWIAVGRGLVAVHDAGLVHRDIKPSNVLIGDDGRPRLIDFGLVRAPGISTLASADALPTTNSDSDRTQGFVGTHAYAAPEQRDGGVVGAATDQYAFCVSVWESLCDIRPPTIPEGVKLPARVQRALERGLAVEPKDRFASLDELLDELEATIDGPSRRLGLILGAAALAAVVTGVAVTQLHESAEAPQRCAIDESALDGTWDAARREALREHFSAQKLEFASTTFAAFEAGLDDWSTNWLEARSSACAATQIAGVQSEAALDLRNACLERKRRAVQVTLDTLLSPDTSSEQLVARAPEVLAQLPTIDDCADPERLAEIAPLPEAGPRRDAIVHGYDVLAEARTLAATGALDRAQAHTSEFVAAHAEALSHVPLQLELAAFPAQLELLRDRTARGVPVLVDVAREAEMQRLDDLAATLLVEAAEAGVGRWSKPELEQWLLAEAEVALRRLDRPSDRRQVALQIARARLLAQAGRLEEALAAHEHARTLAQELGDRTRAETEQLAIAAILATLGRFDAAQTTLEAGRAAAQQRWGDAAPMVGRYEIDLALLALDTGRFDAASMHLDHAEAIARAAFGPASLDVGQIWFARVKLSMIEGEFEAATKLLDEVLPIYSEELGPDHEHLADLHEARGVLRFFAGEHSGSIESYRAALQIRASVLAPEHPALARLHSNIGESQAALGQLADARVSFDRALAIYASTLPTDHPDVALPLKGRGQVELASGRAAQAVEDLERALNLQLTTESEPLEIADLRFSLARALALRDNQRTAEGRELARLARAEFERREMTEQVAAIDAWSRSK